MRINQNSFQEKQTKIYLFSYVYNNASWSVEIPASSKEDAQKRIKEIANAQYDGELELVIDVPSNN